MSKKKNQVINVDGRDIVITQIDDKYYISLSDMAREDGGNNRIQNWMRNRDTVVFLTAWEQIHNPDFNSVQMHRITSDIGLNRFILSPKQWIEATNAIGMISKAGRYGGTYAHKDIAYHFGMWLSPKFSLLVIREFDRLKSEEYSRQKLEWDYQRFLTKVNYRLHTDTIKDVIIPRLREQQNRTPDWLVYAEEADILNMAVFGMMARDWREQNPELARSGNMRDYAEIVELNVLANIESLNTVLIDQGMDKTQRFQVLSQAALSQFKRLSENDNLKQLEE